MSEKLRSSIISNPKKLLIIYFPTMNNLQYKTLKSILFTSLICLPLVISILFLTIPSNRLLPNLFGWGILPSLGTENPIPDKVYNVARSTTVLIGSALSKGQVENMEEDIDAGSGVIIFREDNIAKAFAPVDGESKLFNYYVLTNAHVVSSRNGENYGIRTYDGEVYSVENRKTRPLNIYRFGKQTRESIEGIDLAVLRFSSDKKYPVAPIGEARIVKPKDFILVSGWPNIGDGQKRRRFSIAGQVFEKIEPGKIPGNYTLNYTTFSQSSMSGGPVFNIEGQLIGIHGRRTDTEPYTSFAVDIDQFISLQSGKGFEEVEYKVAFKPKKPEGQFTPILTALTTPDPLAFKNVSQFQGDNITEEEYRKLYGFLDVLPEDPAASSLISLERYGCLDKQDGHLGPGLFQNRAKFVKDLNCYLDRLTELIATATADLVQRDKLSALQTRLEKAAKQIAEIRRQGKYNTNKINHS
ncbi:trypsin-like peptidase domain-containing protein [Calothrix sp. FACHB-156]|nr:trypsin-like peptidase domain-containing protein [Calothrix sp. FACHB-156]